jgi:hypothetical protein
MTITKGLLFFGLLLAIAAPAPAQTPRPADASRSVTVSLGEYNRLIDLAARPVPAPAGPPVAGVVSNADIRVTVDRERARGRFTLDGQMLQDGQGRVSLVAGGTFFDATAQDRAVPLVVEGNRIAAILTGPGPFSLALDWGTPLVYGSGRASFTLPVPRSGAARTTIDLPGEQADVHLSPGVVTRRTVTNGRTIVEATLDPGTSAEVWWTTRESAAGGSVRDTKLLADVLSLISVGDTDVRMVALVDITVLQGELRSLALDLPDGYELTGVTGSSLESVASAEHVATLTIGAPALRSHQFLVSLERAFESGELKLDTGLVRVEGAQRERGELAIEGAGTLALSADEREGLQRIDVRELNPALLSLSRIPLLAAFRYQGTTTIARGVSVSASRFADAGVAAAVIDFANATTLITSEGRAVTEIVLHVQNRSQPFMKVELPAGAMIVSVLINGEAAKPAIGADGARVPLRRAGLTAGEPYEVSFVYVHAGIPFARKGDIAMTLPKMDVPIGFMHWELFAPDRYAMKAIGGNVIDTAGLRPALWNSLRWDAPESTPVVLHRIPVNVTVAKGARRGQIVGLVTDDSGAALPGVKIEVNLRGDHQSAVTNANGRFAFSDVASGSVTVRASLPGFESAGSSFEYDGVARQVDFALSVGSVTETVTVTGAAPVIDVNQRQEPPPNVINVQRRAAGVLPIRVDVPKVGTSHLFVKPLVIDQETTVTLRYKRR